MVATTNAKPELNTWNCPENNFPISGLDRKHTIGHRADTGICPYLTYFYDFCRTGDHARQVHLMVKKPLCLSCLETMKYRFQAGSYFRTNTYRCPTRDRRANNARNASTAINPDMASAAS